MDTYLSNSILELVYSYMNWSDLQSHRNVPNYTWKQYFDYFCQDDEFKDQIEVYWGDIIGCLQYRVIFLNFIYSRMKHTSVHPIILLTNREFILHTVKNGRYITNEFLNDKEIVRHLVSHTPRILKNVNATMCQDRDFILQVTSRNGFVVLYLDNNLKYDNEVLTTAALQIGIEMTDDVFRDIARAAVYRRIIGVNADLDPVYKNDPIISAMIGENLDERRKMQDADKETTITFLKQGGSYKTINTKYWTDKDVAITASN